MSSHESQKRWKSKLSNNRDWRLDIFRYGCVLAVCVIILRLFVLQVLDHGFYEALASGQHEIFQELYPERGTIYVHDLKDETQTALATNQQLAFVYADPRLVKNPEETAQKIGDVFDYTDEEVDALRDRLDQPEDPYEPIERKVSDNILSEIEELNLSGIAYVRETSRYYPEPDLGGHVVGFVGSDEGGNLAGRYGIEGYFENILAGTPGYLRSERDIAGRMITLGEHSIQSAVDGADIVLTLDRTIQYVTCMKLKEKVAEFGAQGGSVVILEPETGRVLAMCGAPDYDPNVYFEAEFIDDFNNPVIFDAYEPGSIFKPMTMAAALDTEAVTPATTFEDTGSAMVEGWPKPIGNAEGKVYGVVDMTTVLEQSINTGMIFSMRETGQDVFVDYVKKFGFGDLTGIELETESAGDISSLDQASEVFVATASFGQGILVTPLQIAAAYAAIANGGILPRPYIIDEIRYDDGTVDIHTSSEVRRVIQEKTSRLLGAMLVSVIEHGHGAKAGVSGYYIAGKTGTAQVARQDGIGYDPDATIGSFAGFGPVDDPKFVMVVRIDRPQGVQWAESTAAPLFGEIAAFLLQYFEVAPTRSVE
ncbi:TPA: hypothetical protein DEP34_03480 [Candidatus Uhrbacteria bacterium]|uniref:Peptidoglycan glycosyltransferase n=2 Tax=Candidatus Uhriibacteriota TaxID=1752732 RepID=A0A0G1Q8C9_9BACT|nr:MAG: Peptidoglycan glycosyltransferase [Candidatus Uhrbacteria bacterium GW2011_GWF2_46_218]KKU41301.1 MAG: Peptidoglycan glycosyltransferase [Candidatus Uhrbacteria bacterium GW2011_GWE2_46_68]HBK33739.1 hypothetical protein [Candidatus Uhrbacteria bacterium]HCB19420.1 hypothetical protein [Candidatus Uhrbacteria bacterium]